MLLTRFVVRMLLSVVSMILGAGGVSGQDYPRKPIRIVASAAGGGQDFVARLIAGISGPLGQPVILEEKLFNSGLEAVGSSCEEFAAKIKGELGRMGKVIKDAGIRTQ